jgi:hypothetical protein
VNEALDGSVYGITTHLEDNSGDYIRAIERVASAQLADRRTLLRESWPAVQHHYTSAGHSSWTEDGRRAVRVAGGEVPHAPATAAALEVLIQDCSVLFRSGIDSSKNLGKREKAAYRRALRSWLAANLMSVRELALSASEPGDEASHIRCAMALLDPGSRLAGADPRSS